MTDVAVAVGRHLAPVFTAARPAVGSASHRTVRVVTPSSSHGSSVAAARRRWQIVPVGAAAFKSPSFPCDAGPEPTHTDSRRRDELSWTVIGSLIG